MRDLGRLGYVIPESIALACYAKNIPQTLRDAHLGQSAIGASTVLFLPLQGSRLDDNSARLGCGESTAQICATVREGMDRLFACPAWFLFLRRLRCVVWEDSTRQPQRRVVVERRHDTLRVQILADGAELVVNDLKFLVHRKVVSVPQELLGHQKAVQEEIAIAFSPSSETQQHMMGVGDVFGGLCDAGSESSRKPVYCFLPVRSVGFRFLLHAHRSMGSLDVVWRMPSVHPLPQIRPDHSVIF